MVRLEDIAKKLNISVVTVSNALADRKGVSDALRGEIKNAAEEMGYKRRERKKSAASSYRANIRGKRIGVLSYDGHMERYASFYWEMYQRTAFRASKLGCVAMLEIFTDEMQRKMIMPALLKERLDGIIFLGKIEDEYLKRIIASSKAPAVLLDFVCEDVNCDSVMSNNFYGMYAMTNYLIRMGHRRIAYVGNILATGSIMDRYQGYCKSLIEHGIEERPDWVISDRDLETGAVEVKKLPEEMPTAFAVNSDFVSGLLLNRLAEDVSVVSFDNYVSDDSMRDFLTTYAVDMDGMAGRAMKLLTERINGGTEPARVYAVDGSIVIRKSVKKIN